MLIASCKDDVVETPGTGVEDNDIAGQMVLFSAGNAENITTRASIPYMEQDGRFVCRMYYRSKIGDTEENPYDVELTNEDDANCHGTQVTAWLKVNNDLGNCIYWNKEYEDRSSDQVNVYGEIGATAFYWQNRLTHAFLALADYNQLKTNKASTGLTMPNGTYKTIESKETQRVYSIRRYELNDGSTVLSSGDIVVTSGTITEAQATSDTEFMNDPETEKSGDEYYDATDGYWYQKSKWFYKTLDNSEKAIYCVIWRVTAEKIKTKYYYKTYDLTIGTKMSEQPDPIQALTLMKPAGATQETNRVKLYFKHQFSQIQVNIRASQDENDEKVDLSQIQSIALLGVTKQGNVYVQLNDDGTVHPTDFEPVNKKTIPTAEWKEPYGTEFEMFDRTSLLSSNEKAQGYFKSSEAIAFGRLEGIRLVWKENVTNVEHKIIFQIPSEDLKTLQSGYRYIYNMELRRGTLALIRTVIKDWEVDETDYSADGTIKPTTGN